MSCSHVKELHRWWTSATVTLREATRAAPQTQLRRVMVSKLFHQLLHAKCEQFIEVNWKEEWKDCVVGKVFPRGEKIMKGHLLRSYTRQHSRRMATWLDRWRLNEDSSGLSNHAYAKTSNKNDKQTKNQSIQTLRHGSQALVHTRGDMHAVCLATAWVNVLMYDMSWNRRKHHVVSQHIKNYTKI